MEELQRLYIPGGSIKWYNHFGKQLRFLQKLNIHLPYDLAIPFLGVYPREIKVKVHKKASLQMQNRIFICIRPNVETTQMPIDMELHK